MSTPTGQTTQLIIPNLVNMQFVDKSGNLTPQAFNFLSQLVTQLQQYLGNGMMVMPTQTAADIPSFAISKFIGGLVYNSTTNKAMLNENGVLKTITTS